MTMRNIRIFVRDVLGYWGALVTGGVIIGALSIYQNLGHTIAPWVYGSIAVIAIVVASYRAWVFQFVKRQEVEEKLKEVDVRARLSIPRVDVHVSPATGRST